MAVARLLGIFILLFYLKVTRCQQGLEVQNIGLHIVPNIQGVQKVQIQNPNQGTTNTPPQGKLQQQQVWQQQQALQQHQAIQHEVIQQQQISQQQAHHQQQTAQQQKAIQQQQAIQLQQALQEQQALQQQQAILKQQQQQTLQQQQAMQQQQALQQQQQQTMQQQQVLQQQRAMQQQQAVQQQQALQQQALQQQMLQQQQALQQPAIQQQVLQPVNLQTSHQSLNLYSPNKLQTVSVQSPQGLPPFNLHTANLQLQGPNSEINIASLPNVKLSTPQPNTGTTSASKNIPTIQFTSLKFIPVVDQKSTALLQNQGVPSVPEIKNVPLTQPQCGNNQITPNSLNLQQNQHTQNMPVQNCHKFVGPLNQLPSVNFNSLHPQPSMIAQSQLPLQSHSTFMLQNPTLSAGQSQLNTLPSPPIISSFNQPSLALQNSLVQTLPKVPSLAVPPQIPVSAIQSPPALSSIQNQPIFPEIRNMPIVPSIQNQPLFSSTQNQALTGPIQVLPPISTSFNSPTLTMQNQPTFISTDRIQNQNAMSIQNPPTITVQNPSILPSVQNQPLFLATQPNMNMQTQPTLSPLSNQISIQSQNPTILNQNHQLHTSLPSQQMVLPQTQTFTAFQNPPASTSIQLQSPMTPQNQLMSIQNQPTISTVQTQSMPTVSTVQSVPIAMTANQPSVIPLQSPAYSILLPPVPSESAHPYLTVSPALPPSAPVKQSKSSSLKSLVPLLINILKERSCGCHNCNCMNKNNHEPTVHGGYSNQKNYGPLPNEPSFLPEVATEPAELFRASRSDNVSIPKDFIKNVIDDESLEDLDDDSEYVDDEDE